MPGTPTSLPSCRDRIVTRASCANMTAGGRAAQVERVPDVKDLIPEVGLLCFTDPGELAR